MDIAISYNTRENLHYLLRVAPRSALTWNPGAGCLAYLDSLLSCKAPSQLLRAVDKMPSLYPDGMFKGRTYWCELSDASKKLADFHECNEFQLEYELQIVNAKVRRTNNTRLTQFIPKYGKGGLEYAANLERFNREDHEGHEGHETYEDREGHEDYEGRESREAHEGHEGHETCEDHEGKENNDNREDNVLLMERLQDWMTLHSSLSLCARLRAQLEADNTPVSLEQAGFAYKAKPILKDNFYIIPFKLNTISNSENAEEDANDPLFDVLAPWAEGEVKMSPADQVYVKRLDKAIDNVFFTSAPFDMGNYPRSFDEPFTARRIFASGKSCYLLARDDGDQDAIAKSIVSLFTRAFRTLKDPGGKGGKGKRDLGWVYDAEGELDGATSPRLVPHSLPSALWYQLVYHPGMRTITCAYCGNAVLAREQGNQRRYCSPSCRVQDAKRARAMEE